MRHRAHRHRTVNAEDNLLVVGSTDVDEGPAVCDDSSVSIVFVLDNNTGDDLSQYAYGTGGHAAFSNHFPSSWTFHSSSQGALRGMQLRRAHGLAAPEVTSGSPTVHLT